LTKRRREKLGGGVVSAKTVAICPAIGLVCRRWGSRQRHSSHNQPSGDKIFTWFVEQVTKAWHTGDVDKSKALLSKVFKLLENRAYTKLIKALEHQTRVVYTKDEKVVDITVRSCLSRSLHEVLLCC